ncbi:type II toxin-antitoxin system Phd/YefM family antitoxin [Aggregatibacter actinomycetemcomitans]|nr:type II toxin-antitoxin system Phd/YefM family antitoxin [Aggregatibacter actinomycetemcomitans]
MAITVTSKEFNQRASYVLKLSETQPVFITKWGKIVSVLSSYRDYQKEHQVTLAEAFSKPKQATPDISPSFEELFGRTLEQVRQDGKMNVPDLSEWE